MRPADADTGVCDGVDHHELRAERLRWLAIGGSLVIGAAVLSGTLAVSSGSAAFYAFGAVLAATWILGALLAGPIPWTGAGNRIRTGVDVVAPVLLGAAVFGGFVVAKLIADHIPFLADSVDDVLHRAHDGPAGVVLVVALVNGFAEEMFFRGALQSAFDARRGAIWATLVYAAVTIATLNAALVVAAFVLGSILAVERARTGGVIAPILTHLTWSALIIVFLPR